MYWVCILYYNLNFFQMAEEALPPVSQDVIKKVRKSLNLDEKRIQEALKGIKDWLELQPHLPKENGNCQNLQQ